MGWYKEQIQLTVIIVVIAMVGEVVFPSFFQGIEIIWPFIWIIGIIIIQIIKRGK